MKTEKDVQRTSTENQIVNDERNIQTLIKTIRGVQVILDRDVSRLYGVATGALNRQVKRNEERFPEDFMFRLSAEKWDNLKCQIGISSWGGDRQLPYAFVVVKYAAWVVTVLAGVLCLLCSWSVGAINIEVMGLSLMDFCDQMTANFMLPLGGMLACLFVGWYIPRKVVHDEFTNDNQLNLSFYRVYLLAVRYVCPVCIILVFLHQLGIL